MGEGILKIFLSSALLSIPVGIASARAAENDGNGPAMQKSEQEAAPDDASDAASALTLFDRRWRPTTKEFVVGTNGIAMAAGTGTEATEANSPEIAYAATGSLRDFTDTTKNSPSNSTGMAPPKETTSVPECGPSPLPPEKIKALVEQAARRHQVDAFFATAIAWTESRFDQSRNSDKGARGPMQLMPETAARFGVQDVCDPEANIEGGMKYLRVLLDEFRNRLLAAAAYDAGESRIYEYGGIPPFKETVGYVAQVINYQIGIPMPALKNRAFGKDAKSAPVVASRVESGIIAVKKTGTFVGGVMHF
ncbi:lytic transglycosylase domain-containing protein [Brucella intermedia]|nr:lytic transglycosylase domain-containing protein [Brucella intermedia]